MRRLTIVVSGVIVTALTSGCAPRAGSLQAASETLGVGRITSIEFSGNGRWYQFGQAPNPSLPWPQFEVSSFTTTVDYALPAARVQMTRKQTIEPGRERPLSAEQKVDQYVSGTTAWNLAAAAGSAAGSAPAVQPQPAAVEERLMEIWTTPHGFLKAAMTNNATSVPKGSGSEVSFTAGGHRYIGVINGANQVERVQTWIDNPVLGDTLVDVTFAEYKDFNGEMFPTRIVREQGGHPVLDLTVASVRTNAPASRATPSEAKASAPPIDVTVETLAPGVYYLKGGTHHSVAIDQKDHVVIVEGPQNEARSLAVIAKVKETIPGKPIKYLINTHAHFDHSGGLRTYVDEGATIVTHELNKRYYEQAWSAPRTLNPDRLAQSKRAPSFVTFTDRQVLTDGTRAIEIHTIAGGGHNDAFAMVYLPAEKILVEGDAFTPLATGAAIPTPPNPFAVNLSSNIQRLKLDVKQIAALHGPRLVTLDDLKSFIGEGVQKGTN